MRNLFPVLLLLAIHSGTAAIAAPAKSGSPPPNAVDCSADYGHAASCEKVPCPALYGEFIGSWTGQFYAYDREKSKAGTPVYRPYTNSINYSSEDCLKEAASGDTFIVGHQTDEYPAFEDLPAKTTTGLLITGRKADATPFLRTVGKDGAHDFALVYRNSAAKLVIWRLDLPAAGGNPQTTLTTIDGRDYSVPSGDARAVTVTLTVGPPNAPYWEGVVAHGTHAKN